jgi:hypothetical protein
MWQRISVELIQEKISGLADLHKISDAHLC